MEDDVEVELELEKQLSLAHEMFWQIRTPYNAVLANLAVAEFVLAFLGVSLDVLAAVQGGWRFGKAACIVTGAMVTQVGK